jgi:transcriptional regulator with XRE-family HTH domain
MSLKTLRKSRRLTQEALAALAGVDQATVSYLERGQAKPSWDTAYRISKALGVKPEAVFPVAPRA